MRLSSGVASALVEQLDVELHAAHAREVVLARVEEHALEQLGGGVERRRIAGTQLAVDFDQRFVLRLDRVLADASREITVPDVVALGEEDFEALDAGFDQLADDGRRSAPGWRRSALRRSTCRPRRRRRRRLPDRWARPPPAAILDLPISFISDGGDLLALADDGFAALGGDGVRKLQPCRPMVSCRRRYTGSSKASCP